MLAGPLPALVDHRKMASQEGQLAGDLPVTHFSRFAEMLAEVEGDVHLELAFSSDNDGRTRVKGQVSVTAGLVCQNCLKAYEQQLEVSLDYVILKAEADQDTLEEEQDSIVITDPKIAIRDLVEDDLILTVPMIPRHPAQCPDSDFVPDDGAAGQGLTAPAIDDETTHRPFAGLAEAMKKQNELEN